MAEKLNPKPMSQETADAVALHWAELEAHAMKPEMDVIAAERAEAPLKYEPGASRPDGGHDTVARPDLTPQQQAEHRARQYYAQSDAREALKLEGLKHNTKKSQDVRLNAARGLVRLTMHGREPRSPEDIARVAK